MWLGCRAGLVVGMIDKVEVGRKEDICHWSMKKRTRTSVDDFAELGDVPARLLPHGGVR